MARPLFSFRYVLAIGLMNVVTLTTAARAEPLSVEMHIEGEDAAALRPTLESLSELMRLKSEGAASLGAVRRLANGDVQRFMTVLTADGFYAARIEPKVSAEEEGFRAHFLITPGERFRVLRYEIRYVDIGLPSRPSDPQALGIETASSSRVADILSVQQAVISRLHAAGYPASRIMARRAEAHLESKTAAIVFMTESGVLASFGPTLWPKDLRTRTDYLDSFVPWRRGQRFDTDRTAELRDELIDTGLFTLISVEPGEADVNGVTPVEVMLTERKPRTFGAGLSYSTNFGVGTQLSWVHRNLMRRGERLEANLNVAQVVQSGKVEFKNPRIFRRTDLVLSASLKNEDNEAFSATTFDATGELHRKLRRNLTGKGGVELFISKSQDAFGSQNAYLVGFPFGLSFNNVENVLNPTGGTIASLTLEPFTGTSGGPVAFSLLEGTGAYHWAFDDKDRWVGALWTRFGASLGATVSAIPPDKRFYAGGAGSVRGYGYRLLGPTDPYGSPIGGRSVLEGGGELRFPIKGDFGGVIFLEGGGVSEQGVFTFDEGVRYGAGIGIRYYTAVGPIRADLALPLDRRRGIDDPFQFYISLGQAF